MEQIFITGDIKTKFLTDPKVSRKELMQFYKDASTIIKKLDPEINSEGDLFFEYGGYWLFPRLPFVRISKIEKSLQVHKERLKIFSSDNIVRMHDIIYRRFPLEVLRKYQKELEENPFGHFFSLRPNIEITSHEPVYKVEKLVNLHEARPRGIIKQNLQV